MMAALIGLPLLARERQNFDAGWLFILADSVHRRADKMRPGDGYI